MASAKCGWVDVAGRQRLGQRRGMADGDGGERRIRHAKADPAPTADLATGADRTSSWRSGGARTAWRQRSKLMEGARRGGNGGARPRQRQHPLARASRGGLVRRWYRAPRRRVHGSRRIGGRWRRCGKGALLLLGVESGVRRFRSGGSRRWRAMAAVTMERWRRWRWGKSRVRRGWRQ